MARLFPLRTETPTREGQPRVVDLEDEDADAVFSALSSTTARRIYTTLNDEPGTPSDVADAIDSSIQNVRYHLEKLEDAGLVEVVDTWYSSRGNEMSVYATANGPLIVTSDQSKAAQLKSALSRLIGGVGVLAGASLFVQYGFSQFFSPDEAQPYHAGDEGERTGDADAWADDPATTDGDGDAADAPDDETEDADTADDGEDELEAETTTVDQEDDEGDDEAADDDATDDEAADDDSADDDGTSGDGEFYGEGPTDDAGSPDGLLEAMEAGLATIPPGALFFLGGLVVLALVSAYWYWSVYRL